MYYYRHDGYGHQFGLHVWEDVVEETSWDAPLPANAACNGWVSFEVALAPGAQNLSFIVHRGDEQCTKVLNYDVGDVNAGTKLKLWLGSGATDVFSSEPDVRSMPTGVVDLQRARATAHPDIIAVPFGDLRVHARRRRVLPWPRRWMELDGYGGVVKNGEYGGEGIFAWNPRGSVFPVIRADAPGEVDGGWARKMRGRLVISILTFETRVTRVFVCQTEKTSPPAQVPAGGHRSPRRRVTRRHVGTDPRRDRRYVRSLRRSPGRGDHPRRRRRRRRRRSDPTGLGPDGSRRHRPPLR